MKCFAIAWAKNHLITLANSIAYDLTINDYSINLYKAKDCDAGQRGYSMFLKQHFCTVYRTFKKIVYGAYIGKIEFFNEITKKYSSA